MQFANKYGPWVVIAGSAEGLGEAWSLALAKRGMNLVMVDQKEQKLIELSQKLNSEYGIDVLPLSIDLSDPNAASLIMEKTESLDCRLLIYNAAYSLIKPFTDHTAEEFRYFIAQ